MTENTEHSKLPYSPHLAIDLNETGLGGLKKMVKEVWLGDPKDLNFQKIELGLLHETWFALGNWLSNDQGEEPKTSRENRENFNKLTTYLHQQGALEEDAVAKQAQFEAWVQGGEMVSKDTFK